MAISDSFTIVLPAESSGASWGAQPEGAPAGLDQVHAQQVVVELAVVADTRFHFAEAVERAQHRGSTPMLDRVDIYRTLELSWDEMPQFLGELDQLLAVAVDDQEREVLEAVNRLGERCRDDRALALRLVGD